MRIMKVAGGCAAIVLAIGAALAPASYGTPGSGGSPLAGEMAVLTGKGLSPALASEALTVQAEVGRTGLVSRLEAALGDEYAEVWFAPAAAQFHIGVSSQASRHAAEAVVAQAGMSAAVTAAVRYTSVRSTRARLQAVQEKLNVRLAHLLARQEAMTGILSSSNAVSVTLSSAVPSRERSSLEREATTAGANVSFNVVPASRLRVSARKRSTCDLPFKTKESYCSKTITAGVLITFEKAAKPKEYCTAGPLAIPKKNKLETYVLTAGHCILEATNEPWYSSTQKGAETGEIGSHTDLVLGEKGDYGDILANNPGFWTEAGLTPVFPGVVKWGSEEEKASPVGGEEPSVENLANCHQGATSGEQCGVVKLVNQTFTYEVGKGGTAKKVTVKGLVKDEACGEGGDSGGPWINVTKGGEVRVNGTEAAGPPEKCVGHTCKKCESYYEPIKTSLEGLGLELLTTANETRPENPRIAPVPTEAKPAKFTSETDKTVSKLEAEKSKMTIECQKVTDSGEFTSERLGVITIDLTECKSGAVNCNTTGDAAGTILIDKANLHLVDVLLSKEVLGLGLAVKLNENLKVKCGILTVEIKGTVLGEALSIKQAEKTKHLEVVFNQKEGKQEFTTCNLDKAFCEKEGKKIQYVLEANFGKGFEQTGEQSTDLVTFENEVEFYF